MVLTVKNFNKSLEKKFLYESRPSVAVGVSGGPDSLALVILLSKWVKEKKGRLVALIIDHKIRSLRRTISEGEAMQFNCMVLDMHPYVGDEVFAKEEGMFNKRLVAGAMVFSYGLGLVATNCVNSFSYGYDRLRFIKPVFIGDTIYTIRTNMEKKPKYEKMGLVRTSYEVFKGKGEIVLYCEHLHSVLYKEPEKFKDQVQKK